MILAAGMEHVALRPPGTWPLSLRRDWGSQFRVPRLP
jgi:hypothetical protein